MQNERNFLESSMTRNFVNFNRVQTLLSTVSDSKKKKFDASIELSRAVKKAHTWFNSEEGKQVFLTEGIAWNTEMMFGKVFGWNKSFAFKMLKVGALTEENSQVVTKFKRECTRLEGEGESVSRSIEALLKFAKATEENGENAEVETRPTVLLELKMRGYMINETEIGAKKVKITGDFDSPIFKTDMSVIDVEVLEVYINKLKQHLTTISEENSSEGLPFQ